MNDAVGVRLDQWLWAARFYKTRALAKAAIENGQVLVNDQRVKPARTLKPGDRLHIDKHGAQIYDLIVEKSEAKRVAAPVAQTYYQETAANCKRNSAPPANSCNTPNAARTNATAGKSAPSATAANNRPALASRYT